MENNYTTKEGKLYKNDIQLDFLWSIQGNMDTLK
jgi:hypothetical protein